MKAIKTIAKVALTVTLLASVVLVFSEASTKLLQICVSGGSLLTSWLSYKGLDALGAFDTIK